MEKIRKLSEFGKFNWTGKVKEAVSAYNRSFHRAIGMTPNEMYGIDTFINIEENIISDKDVGNADLVKNREEKAKFKLKKYREEYERGYLENGFELGQRVMFYDSRGNKPKLSSKWNDIGEIIEIGYNSYKLKLDRGKYVVANRSQIKSL